MTPQSPIISTLQKSYEPTLLTVLCHLQFFLENRNVRQSSIFDKVSRESRQYAGSDAATTCSASSTLPSPFIWMVPMTDVLQSCNYIFHKHYLIAQHCRWRYPQGGTKQTGNLQCGFCPAGNIVAYA